MSEQGRDVIGERVELHLAFDVGGAPMALQLDGDDLVVLGEWREQLRKVRRDVQEPAVEQDQGRALAVHLVIERQPVD